MSMGHSRVIARKFYFSVFSNTTMTIKDQKTKLRDEVTRELSKLTKEEKDKQSEKVIRKVLGSPEFQNSQRISIYLSTEYEINTKPIVQRIFKEGKECFIPRYSKAGMDMVKLTSMEDWENLPLTAWKIKQPRLREERENALHSGGLDLLIVPGVAFTKNGKRLGHGGGYYDRYIQNLRDNLKKPIVTVAVAFNEQVFNEIPTQEHDEIIDRIFYVQ